MIENLLQRFSGQDNEGLRPSTGRVLEDRSMTSVSLASGASGVALGHGSFMLPFVDRHQRGVPVLNYSSFRAAKKAMGTRLEPSIRAFREWKASGFEGEMPQILEDLADACLTLYGRSASGPALGRWHVVDIDVTQLFAQYLSSIYNASTCTKLESAELAKVLVATVLKRVVSHSDEGSKTSRKIRLQQDLATLSAISPDAFRFPGEELRLPPPTAATDTFQKESEMSTVPSNVQISTMSPRSSVQPTQIPRSPVQSMQQVHSGAPTAGTRQTAASLIQEAIPALLGPGVTMSGPPVTCEYDSANGRRVRLHVGGGPRVVTLPNGGQVTRMATPTQTLIMAAFAEMAMGGSPLTPLAAAGIQFADMDNALVCNFAAEAERAFAEEKMRREAEEEQAEEQALAYALEQETQLANAVYSAPDMPAPSDTQAIYGFGDLPHSEDAADDISQFAGE